MLGEHRSINVDHIYGFEWVRMVIVELGHCERGIDHYIYIHMYENVAFQQMANIVESISYVDYMWFQDHPHNGFRPPHSLH